MKSDAKYVYSTFKLNLMPRLLRGNDILLNNTMPPKDWKIYGSILKESMKG